MKWGRRAARAAVVVGVIIAVCVWLRRRTKKTPVPAPDLGDVRERVRLRRRWEAAALVVVGLGATVAIVGPDEHTPIPLSQFISPTCRQVEERLSSLDLGARRALLAFDEYLLVVGSDSDGVLFTPEPFQRPYADLYEARLPGTVEQIGVIDGGPPMPRGISLSIEAGNLACYRRGETGGGVVECSLLEYLFSEVRSDVRARWYRRFELLTAVALRDETLRVVGSDGSAEASFVVFEGNHRSDSDDARVYAYPPGPVLTLVTSGGRLESSHC